MRNLYRSLSDPGINRPIIDAPLGQEERGILFDCEDFQYDWKLLTSLGASSLPPNEEELFDFSPGKFNPIKVMEHLLQFPCIKKQGEELFIDPAFGDFTCSSLKECLLILKKTPPLLLDLNEDTFSRFGKNHPIMEFQNLRVHGPHFLGKAYIHVINICSPEIKESNEDLLKRLSLAELVLFMLRAYLRVRMHFCRTLGKENQLAILTEELEDSLKVSRSIGLFKSGQLSFWKLLKAFHLPIHCPID